MSLLLERLKPKERRGSKPRCHFLTHGSPQTVAARLTAIASPYATVSSSDRWMPHGFEDTEEAMLPGAARLLPPDLRRELREWWLAVASPLTRTPNWDIASTCTIEGKAGILLVEAKAHLTELEKEAAGKKLDVAASPNSKRNHSKIGEAIREASAALAEHTGLPWALSRDSHYQMSNRFAWAWKLSELGVPVVLVYLGFEDASEMSDQGLPIGSAIHWDSMVKSHSAALFPAEVWNRSWRCNGQALIPLIRSMMMPMSEETLR